MTAVLSPLETLAYNTATAVASPAAETAILSTDAVTAGVYVPAVPAAAVSPFVTHPVIIRVNINITEGTTGTAFVVRCRQGVGVGGALVGTARTVTLAAAASFDGTLVFRDTAPVTPGASAYTITVAETGATANGTVNAIDVEILQ